MEHPSNGPIIWYTHPEHPFDSFYYYNPETLVLIRVRLELGRDADEDDDGRTCAIYMPNRYVGFYPPQLDAKIWNKDKGPQGTFTGIAPNRVKWNDTILTNEPEKGFGVCDFEGEGLKKKGEHIHIGNFVDEDLHLPKGVTKEQLLFIAKLAAANKAGGFLTAKNANEKALADAIDQVVNTGTFPAAPAVHFQANDEGCTPKCCIIQ